MPLRSNRTPFFSVWRAGSPNNVSLAVTVIHPAGVNVTKHYYVMVWRRQVALSLEAKLGPARPLMFYNIF